MAITIGTRYAIPRGSAWEINQAWREKRRRMVEGFQNDSAAAGGLATAMSNQISGAANLTAQIANKRVQKEVLAKRIQAMNLAKV